MLQFHGFIIIQTRIQTRKDVHTMGDFIAISSGWLSILPPIIAIILALLTKEVYSSLFAGLFTGMLIYAYSTGGNLLTALYHVFEMMASKLGDNGFLIIFLTLLGALVFVITKAGGSNAYGAFVANKIKTKRGAKIFSSILGLLIFIDDYFNCLTVGTVMRPVTDRHRISREKLAYIIDSTAAPICIIAPISSWAVAVAGDLGEDGFTLFMKAIPYNLYALLTIAMVIFICFTDFDFGPMAKAERATKLASAPSEMVHSDNENDNKKGSVADLLIPIGSLIVCSVFGMAYVGGYFSGTTDFTTALGVNPSAGLSLGAFAALIIALVMFISRRRMTYKEFMEGVVDGAKSMIPAILILILAWSLSSVCRYMLGTGEYVSSVITSLHVSLNLFPFIVFIAAAILSFAMGTAWGTFGILLPIVIMVCSRDTSSNILVASMGATLAGSVFGDHCSPISDTTILSSTGANCDHLAHISTQIPYALLVAFVSAIGYLLAGWVNNPVLPLLISFILLFSILSVMYRFQKK